MRRKVSVLAFLVTLVACSLSLGNRIAFEVDDGVIKRENFGQACTLTSHKCKHVVITLTPLELK